MQPEPITKLKNLLEGHDIYVIASGPSAGYIAPQFFDNKYAIGVNNVWLRFPNVDWVVRKEFNNNEHPSVPQGKPLIMAKHACGSLSRNVNRYDGGEWYVFEHENNNLVAPDLTVIGTDKIIVSYSTITSAMHIAAYMGAYNIILVGHDCGWLDGKSNIDGYPPPIATDAEYIHFLNSIEPQTLAIRQVLNEVYGVNIYSLNPFVNFGLEGHEYERER